MTHVNIPPSAPLNVVEEFHYAYTDEHPIKCEFLQPERNYLMEFCKESIQESYVFLDKNNISAAILKPELNASILKTVSPEADVITIESIREQGCKMYIYETATKEFHLRGVGECGKTRVFGLHSILPNKNLSVDQLINRLKSLDELKNLNLEVQKLGSNFVRIYNQEAQQNILLDGKLWEKIGILLIITPEYGSMEIRSTYASGIKPPSNEHFKDSLSTYADEVLDFKNKLEAEMLKQ